MATLRWMGVPESEVMMVEGMYEKTTARVVVGEGASEEFEITSQWTEAGQRAEPAAVHSSTGPHQQDDGDEGCHIFCVGSGCNLRRPVPRRGFRGKCCLSTALHKLCGQWSDELIGRRSWWRIVNGF